jgi:hypothetical protein
MASTSSSFAFASINNMLIYNKCWLCQQPFQRGKMKKVFQVSDLLDFFAQRHIAESTSKSSSEDGASAPSEAFKSTHLNECYECFKQLTSVDSSGNIDTKNFLSAFRENDLETWMSGLVCAMSESCREEMAYFVKDLSGGKAAASAASSTSSAAPVSVFKDTIMSSKDCPPGCNCDNPWPFLS